MTRPNFAELKAETKWNTFPFNKPTFQKIGFSPGARVPNDSGVGYLQDNAKDTHPNASILAVTRNALHGIRNMYADQELLYAVGMDVRVGGIIPQRWIGKLLKTSFTAIDYNYVTHKYAVNESGDHLAVATGEGHFQFMAYPGLLGQGNEDIFGKNGVLAIPSTFLVASHVPKQEVHDQGIVLI